jgi:hypothetical protein
LDLLNTCRSYTQVTIALSLIHTLRNLLQYALSLLSVLCRHLLSGNVFQHRKFFSYRVQRLLSLLTGVCPTTRLGIATQRFKTVGSPPPPTPLGQLSATTSDGSVSQLLTADTRLSTHSSLTGLLCWSS